MKSKPFVLSIAGYDPCGGAGVLSDVKTFQQMGVYGLAATTCITYQHDTHFYDVHWLSFSKIKKQLQPLFKAYKINWVKIGLIKDSTMLIKLLKFLLEKNENIKIIWDPILRSGSGFNFKQKITKKDLKFILDTVFMITPNWNEVQPLSKENDVIAGAQKLAQYTHVYLKGGHNIETPGTDMIWINKQLDILHPAEITNLQKHGTGCVLSSALSAGMAQGNTIHHACELAKAFTLKYITSNPTNLGYH